MIKDCIVWPTFFLLNIFTALKGIFWVVKGLFTILIFLSLPTIVMVTAYKVQIFLILFFAVVR